MPYEQAAVAASGESELADRLANSRVGRMVVVMKGNHGVRCQRTLPGPERSHHRVTVVGGIDEQEIDDLAAARPGAVRLVAELDTRSNTRPSAVQIGLALASYLGVVAEDAAGAIGESEGDRTPRRPGSELDHGGTSPGEVQEGTQLQRAD